MRLPAPLQLGIEQEISQLDLKELTRAAEELSNEYRNWLHQGAFPSNLAANHVGRVAYLATRVPATYVAIYSVLCELKQRIPAFEVRSLLDLGAGPGTAMWAAAELFHELQQVTLVERNSGFIRLGQKLSATVIVPSIQNARWVEGDLIRETQFPPHDLALISYSLGELAPEDRRPILQRARQAAAKAIAVIEPGTPRGFQVVLQARSELLQESAHLVAPCPHEGECPMASQIGTVANPLHPNACRSTLPSAVANEDWCHFSQRLERTSLHRKLKSAELGYEDEKFSYVAAARQDVTRAAARVIRHPLQLKGHIKLELCALDGLRQETITRKQGEAFKRARRTNWGDAWE